MAGGIWRCMAAGTVALLWGLGAEAQSFTRTESAGAIAPASPSPCVTGDSLLDSPAMRDLMRLLWAHSNANGWPAERTERAGFLFDSAGVLVYQADLDSHNTPCRSSCVVPITGRPMAAVMTHPFRPGDLLPESCAPGNDDLRRYDVSRFGGASEPDLDALTHWGTPGYIVDQVNVYAIPYGTTKVDARRVVKRYPRVDPETGCKIF